MTDLQARVRDSVTIPKMGILCSTRHLKKILRTKVYNKILFNPI